MSKNITYKQWLKCVEDMEIVVGTKSMMVHLLCKPYDSIKHWKSYAKENPDLYIKEKMKERLLNACYQVSGCYKETLKDQSNAFNRIVDFSFDYS